MTERYAYYTSTYAGAVVDWLNKTEHSRVISFVLTAEYWVVVIEF